MKLQPCKLCGQQTSDVYCLKCCGKITPKGPPLKRLRRYGFKLSYSQKQDMKMLKEINGAIPTEADQARETIKVSHLYVACDGNTYIRHCWIGKGSSFSWSEGYPERLPR